MRAPSSIRCRADASVPAATCARGRRARSGWSRNCWPGLDQRERILELQRDTLQVRLVSQRETYALRKRPWPSGCAPLHGRVPQRDLELILTSESFSTLVARSEFNTMLARLDGNLVARTREQARIEAEEAAAAGGAGGNLGSARGGPARAERTWNARGRATGTAARGRGPSRTARRSQLAELRGRNAAWPTSWPATRGSGVSSPPSSPTGRHRPVRLRRAAAATCRGRCPGRWCASSGATCTPASGRSPCTTGSAWKPCPRRRSMRWLPERCSSPTICPATANALSWTTAPASTRSTPTWRASSPFGAAACATGRSWRRWKPARPASGPTLYFEIREGREARNPRDWLRPLR